MDLLSPSLAFAFRALRHPAFRRYWLGWAISVLGSWMQTLAQGWLVFRLTNSPQVLGLLTALRFGPTLLGLPLAGVLTDYVSRKRLLVMTQAASIMQASVLAVLTLSGQVRVWHVLLLALVQGCIDTVDMPSRQSFQAELVPVADLQSAISLNSAVFNAGRLVGPALAGLVVAEVGEGWCFALNAVSFVPFLLAVLTASGSASPRPGSLDVRRHLAGGMVFAWNCKPIRPLLTGVFVTAAFGLSYSTLLPAFAGVVLRSDARGYGLLLAASGLGAVVGSLGAATRTSRGWQVVGRFQLLLGLALTLLALAGNLWLAAAALVLSGFSIAGQLATTNGYIQIHSPDHLRARLVSLYIWVFSGSTPLGGLVAGFLAEQFGLATAIAAGGGACVAAALSQGGWVRSTGQPER
ncbi:MAG: MFS transporter [Thermoanaerobaculum sp.]|nr:MFS transporter [Thermoanaerobaculum sp.]